ncbi:hypothetical protein VOLCADRAFT_83936 [Volvox carteri f. nagariensis]|uniref:Mitochondrial glycoprotein n=1 Tax=Volvox carteri f. nagariensis TaxID=3068 RepID=D8UEL6_VOLCA|nr:uncharacterized protein VOLCADRAFT_83936 [Volvox carteri f. nagariensis]EFJ41865.1 hypothetical protein VOLCADRAFT_83936 [Volvox carteri f. nagariensis]|eukprot:XP_002957063.1 hypothetical protein VOLCADRAFT_83936 [Volvox carteri f. nagariensis]
MASRQRLARGICSLFAQRGSAACKGPQAAGLMISTAQQSAHHNLHQAAQLPLLRCAAAAFSRSLTTSASSLNSSLSSLLREELDFEKKNYVRPEQVSGGPPAPFKLTEAPGDTLLTLSRTYKNEEISIDLHVNNQPSPPYEDEEADEEGITMVAFNVSVLKEGKVLLFECESDGSSVNINHVSLEPKEGLASESMYSGPVFEELDDSLQRNFFSFLEERGITAELGEYLRFLIYDKEQREYQTWLGEVEKFTSK